MSFPSTKSRLAAGKYISSRLILCGPALYSRTDLRKVRFLAPARIQPSGAPVPNDAPVAPAGRRGHESKRSGLGFRTGLLPSLFLQKSRIFRGIARSPA